jgi:hypothetical protein
MRMAAMRTIKLLIIMMLVAVAPIAIYAEDLGGGGTAMDALQSALATPSAMSGSAIERATTIAELSGIVEVKTIKAGWEPAREGMILKEGDIIRTKSASRAILNIDGEAKTAVVEVKENSEMALAELKGDIKEDVKSTLLDLAIGDILIKAKKIHSEKSKFEVKTPTSFIGIRGTIFSVSVKELE